MKIKEGFMLRTVAGQTIVVPVGNAAVSFNGMISLNESGAFLWSKLSGENDRDGLINALLEEYDVTKELASCGVDMFLKKIREAKLLDE